MFLLHIRTQSISEDAALFDDFPGLHSSENDALPSVVGGKPSGGVLFRGHPPL